MTNRIESQEETMPTGMPSRKEQIRIIDSLLVEHRKKLEFYKSKGLPLSEEENRLIIEGLEDRKRYYGSMTVLDLSITDK